MEDFSKMKKTELLKKCKELSIIKCSNKNKTELIELINTKLYSNNKEHNIDEDANKKIYINIKKKKYK